MTRRFDIVLFGATGFTGGLTAEYLLAHAPEEARVALAGRSEARLAAVRDRLGRPDVELVTADSADRDSLRLLAESTRVLISTVGPYLEHGRELVAACAEAGTDYLDLTGEPQFVDETYLAHHATAQASGARLVHACGFDSIPHDLGAYFTVRQLPDGVPLRLRGVVRASGTASGGTFGSALNQFASMREASRVSRERRKREGRPEGRRVRATGGKVHRDPVLGYWLVPLPTIDPFIVVRSAAALPQYGPDFGYAHYAGLKRRRTLAMAAPALLGLVAAAQVGPLRRWLLRRVPEGTGPDPAKRERSWFRVTFVGEGGGRTVTTRVSGGDPGYAETSKMLAESALCLAFDDNPHTSGQVTTAQAMGDRLLERLIAAGIRFEVVE